MKILKIKMNGKVVKEIDYSEPTFKGPNFNAVEYAHDLARKYIQESKSFDILLGMMKHQVFVEVA